MSLNSEIAFMDALNSGRLKNQDLKTLKFLELMGPHTWQEMQSHFERILGKRMKDATFSSSVSRLNKDGKIKIVGDRFNPSTGFMNSVYALVD